MWDKPERAKPIEQWKEQSFEDGPAGAYIPNMSKEDAQRWKAKLVGKTTGHPQVQIRKTTKGSQMLIIVSLGEGYKYSYYTPENTKGVNVHIALNGPGMMTFEDMENMQKAVEEAKEYLHNLNNEKSSSEKPI